MSTKLLVSSFGKSFIRPMTVLVTCIILTACGGTTGSGAPSAATSGGPSTGGGGAALTASAGGPYAGPPNVAIGFSGTASGGVPPYSYAWNFGDGTQGTGQTSPHSYASSGTYNVSLTVTDASKAEASASAQATIAAEPLLQPSDFTYVGSFRLPPGASGIDPQGFSYSNGSTSGNVYNDPLNGPSLFISCYLEAGYIHAGVSVAEVAIPQPLNINQVGLKGLQTAKLVQPCSDPSAPGANPLAPNIGGGNGLCTFIALTQDLLGFCAVSYNASNSQSMNAFVGSYNFANPDGAGPYNVTGLPESVYGRYSGLVPPEWQAALGGDIFAGNGNGISIISVNSDGPALAVMHSSAFLAKPAAGSAISSTVLAFYPDPGHPQLGVWNSNLPGQTVNGIAVPDFTVTDPQGRTVPDTGNGTGPTWTIPAANQADSNNGVLFADGSSSVVYFGRLGMGPYCYGEGTGNASLIGQTDPTGSIYCYDPDNSGKGDHAYPYTAAAWFFNTNDYAAVAAGQKAPYMVFPYALVPFPAPGAGDTLGGASWDPVNRLMYIALPGADPGTGYFFGPIIDVYKVN